jgi:hypothetical protein
MADKAQKLLNQVHADSRDALQPTQRIVVLAFAEYARRRAASPSIWRKAANTLRICGCL